WPSRGPSGPSGMAACRSGWPCANHVARPAGFPESHSFLRLLYQLPAANIDAQLWKILVLDAPWPATFGDKTSQRDNVARHLITTRRSVPNDSVAITAALAEGALQLAADPRNACPIKVVE